MLARAWVQDHADPIDLDKMCERMQEAPISVEKLNILTPNNNLVVNWTPQSIQRIESHVTELS